MIGDRQVCHYKERRQEQGKEFKKKLSTFVQALYNHTATGSRPMFGMININVKEKAVAYS